MSVRHTSDLLTVREAAQLLKVSTMTIKRWLKQGRLVAYHVGPRALRIKQEDLQDLLRPATASEASMKQEQRPFSPPPKEEIARRQALVATIQAKREERVITPLTAAELVRRSREEEMRSYDTEK